MSGERDLGSLFRTLDPTLHPGTFVFVSLPRGQTRDDVDAIARFREAEGETLIVEGTVATRHALTGHRPSRLITLGAQSSLDAVGFLASIATDLAAAGIPTNVVSAFHHDHVFVPVGRETEALRILRRYGAHPPRNPAPLSGVDIRPSTPDDLASLHACFHAVAAEGEWLARVEPPPIERMKQFIEDLAAGAGVQCLALRGSRVLGWCDVYRKPFPAFDHSGVLGMGILESERGHGIGNALLHATLRAAARIGVTRVELEVFTTNGVALDLYRRHGFLPEGIKRRARVRGEDVRDLLCMARLEPDAEDPFSTGPSIP